ncbi:hypothetical protein ACSQ67_023859 [Phaseolus vulgaris]
MPKYTSKGKIDISKIIEVEEKWANVLSFGSFVTQAHFQIRINPSQNSNSNSCFSPVLSIPLHTSTPPSPSLLCRPPPWPVLTLPLIHSDSLENPVVQGEQPAEPGGVEVPV